MRELVFLCSAPEPAVMSLKQALAHVPQGPRVVGFQELQNLGRFKPLLAD